MPQDEWFESWFASPWYTLLYQHRDDLEAEEFVQNLMRYLQPLPGNRMLDVACGEGRHSIELADHGYDVTGIDLSQRSIAKAKESENEHLHFYVHDMRMPFYVNYFDFVFNFFTSFGYFERQRDNLLAAKMFAAALKPDGLLVLDYLNRDYSARRLVPEETVERGGISFHIRRRIDDSHFIKDIAFEDENGQQHQYTERVAALRLADFVDLFRQAGLSLVGTFGDYRLGAYEPLESPRLIMIFKK